jgi:IS5 family transposase
MGSNAFDLWNALIIKKADDLKPTKKKMIGDDDDTQGLQKNKGTLKIDATVANHKIVFPTDAGFLNTARKETECFIDLLLK